MSLHSSFPLEILPQLPGYRSRELSGSPKRPVNFHFVQGQMFAKDESFPNFVEETFTSSIGSQSRLSLSFSNSPKRSPDRSQQQPSTLRFEAFFQEIVGFGSEAGQKRIRRCFIYYFVEEGKLKIVEQSVLRSSNSKKILVQKTFVLRPDGAAYEAEDFAIGEVLLIFGQQYFLINCDSFTREYLELRGCVVGDPIACPVDQVTAVNLAAQFDDETWARYHSKRNANKTYMEAMLGNTTNNSLREGYMRYGNRSLSFNCVWDNTDTLYGDRMRYSMKYYLSDDTIEIFAVHSVDVEREFSRLLKRCKLPRGSQGLLPVGVAPSEDCFHWRDFHIGLVFNLYGREMQIVDSDSETRRFYDENSLSLGPAVAEPAPVQTNHDREVPPRTPFGSDEDSLRSCQGASLIPGPPRMKKQGEDRKLCFFASLLTGGLEDIGRHFIITYYVVDETLAVHEPPIRNSGFVGGVFLSRRAVRTELDETLLPSHLYLGCKLQLMKHRFLLEGANEGTLRWMEDRMLPRANFYAILSKLRPVWQPDIESGQLQQLFRQLLGAGTAQATKDTLAAVMDRYQLRGDGQGDISEHELMTIVRANGNKLPTFDFVKFLEQIIRPTDEFK